MSRGRQLLIAVTATLLTAAALVAATLCATPALADNAANFKAHVAARGVGVNSTTFSAPVYRQCVPWRPPWSPCDSSHVRINVTHLNWAGDWSAPELTARWQNVPVPSGFKPASGSDKQAVVLNYIEDRYVEFWGLRKDPAGKWLAAWGGGERMADMVTGPGGLKIWPTSQHHYGTAASGIAMVPGLILLDDLRRGQINHPVMFSVSNACTTHKPPATRNDGLGGADCIQYGAMLKLPAGVDVDAVTSDSRWCAPSANRTADEAAALGWNPATLRCPLAPVARMLAKAMQSHFIVATDQTTWGIAPQFTLENWDRPRTGNWANVPVGSPYKPYFGCDDIQSTGHSDARPVAPGETEGDCTTTGSWKGFPWSQVVEVP